MNASAQVLAPSEAGDLSHVERRLEARFCPPLQPSEVRRCTTEAAASLQSAPIRTFVALLIERAAAERLRALASTASAEVREIAVVAVPGYGAGATRPPGRLGTWWRGLKLRRGNVSVKPALIRADERHDRRNTKCC
jgi:hypothetical protein